MKFCPKCGNNLETGQDICPKCGNNIKLRQNKEKPISTAAAIVEKKAYPEVRSKGTPLSPFAKVFMIVIGIIVILLIGLFSLGNSLSKPSKVVTALQNDITSGNKADLINVLYCDDNRLQINEKSVTPLLTYFKDNPSSLNTLVKELNNEAIEAESNPKLFETKNSNNSLFSLKYVGKRLLFFPKYKIAVKPTFFTVNTALKDIVLSLDGTEIGKSDKDNYSKEFGPYMPQKYTLTATYKGKYVSLTESHDVDLSVTDSEKASVDVFTSLNYINIESEYPEAEIFVNNKDTGIKVKDAENFGPLSSGTKVYATVINNGRTLKSDEYTVSEGDTNIDLSFEEAETMIENIQSQLNNLIYDYTNGFSQAINYGDFSSVSYTLYPGSDLYNAQQKYVTSTYDKGIRENVMSYNVTSYTLSDDTKSGTVTTEEVYNIENNGQSSVKTFKYTYGFKYNETTSSYQLSTIATVK